MIPSNDARVCSTMIVTSTVILLQWSLSSGAAARRLGEARTRAAVQLLLVQACGEIFHIHNRRLKPEALTGILDVVKQLADHARQVDMDMSLRRHLAAAQATDKVCSCTACSAYCMLMEKDAAADIEKFCAWVACKDVY